MIQVLIGLAALAAPILVIVGLVVLCERSDGLSRFVVVGGRTRRRRAVEINKFG